MPYPVRFHQPLQQLGEKARTFRIDLDVHKPLLVFPIRPIEISNFPLGGFAA